MIRLHEALDLARDKSATGATKPAQEPPIVIPWEFGRDPEKPAIEPSAARAPEPAPEPAREPEIEAAPRRYGSGVLIAALAAVVGLAGYAVWMSSTSGSQDLRLSGIVAANQIVVASNLPGRIDRLTVDEGARVEAAISSSRLIGQSWKRSVRITSASSSNSMPSWPRPGKS